MEIGRHLGAAMVGSTLQVVAPKGGGHVSGTSERVTKRSQTKPSEASADMRFSSDNAEMCRNAPSDRASWVTKRTHCGSEQSRPHPRLLEPTHCAAARLRFRTSERLPALRSGPALRSFPAPLWTGVVGRV